jgi:hypothetical protein
MSLILGVGKGTFAVLVTLAIAILLSLLGAMIKPQQAALITIASLILPAIVLGLVAAAPKPGEYDDVSIDSYYPVRVTLIVLQLLGLLLAFFADVVLPVLKSPKYYAPRTESRRKLLKANHPTWVK